MTTFKFKTLDDLDVAGKSVLVRVDFNVPMQDGRVTDTTRIERAIPTIEELARRGARVVLMSHLGRPGGRKVDSLSLEPVARPLTAMLHGRPVVFIEECIGATAQDAIGDLADGDVALLENLRFHSGEEVNEVEFASALAKLGDLYVNDAFSTAHREHASVEAITHLIPSAAGRLMQMELQNLSAALTDPKRPLAAIIGGAKISTKIGLLENLVDKTDLLILGGGLANTFLHALKVEVGTSLYEPEMARHARDLMKKVKKTDCTMLIPVDAVLESDLAAGAETKTVPIKRVLKDRMIMDIGPKTCDVICERLEGCRTVIWNGPLGCFEVPPFDTGTVTVAQKVAELTRDGKLFSLAGGGETLAALRQARVAQDFSYLSTAGGAFLEWMKGKTLSGVKALEDAAAEYPEG